MRISKRALVVVLLAVAVSLGVGHLFGLGAQEIQGLPQVPGQTGQSLRPYWHVFIAYALAIVLIGGWAVSIGRRLREVESRLSDSGE